MKYVCLALCISVVAGCYFIGRLYYDRGRADCESRYQAVVAQSVSQDTQARADAAHRANITPSRDIRDWLRQNYTIAE